MRILVSDHTKKKKKREKRKVGSGHRLKESDESAQCALGPSGEELNDGYSLPQDTPSSLSSLFLSLFPTLTLPPPPAFGIGFTSDQAAARIRRPRVGVIPLQTRRNFSRVFTRARLDEQFFKHTHTQRHFLCVRWIKLGGR